jgi:catechol 2,3-dioxygenase-like lactoylglutathione lyase family enzyme
MHIDQLDHLVLTVRDLAATTAFYVDVLGMEAVTFGRGRLALLFGAQKINLHEFGREPTPRSAKPTPGSADLCLLTRTPMNEVVEHLRSRGVAVIDGPVKRTGATGPILSVYVRDPDGNLVEISNALEPTGPPIPASPHYLDED